MKSISIILLTFAFISSCATTERVVDKKTPEVTALLVCTAGVLSSYKISADIDTALNKAASEKKLNLQSSVEINDWVKGYIFEKIPESDALEAYKLYVACYEKEIRRGSGYDLKRDINVYNSPGSITTNNQKGNNLIINTSTPTRHLDKNNIAQIESMLTNYKGKKVIVGLYTGDGEAYQFANEIVNYLKSKKSNKWELEFIQNYGLLRVGQDIFINSEGYLEIAIGTKKY